ncbi:hypothetical protein [Streptomyces sp. NPDC048720]|uniref:hypothetical protein n=1 Tax=Streptomyces sp. NPDC048720 TaxID=3365588 RepID=UPI003710C77A
MAYNQTEVLEDQAKILKVFLDGMNCYLYVNDEGQIMLNHKTTFSVFKGVPIEQED